MSRIKIIVDDGEGTRREIQLDDGTQRRLRLYAEANEEDIPGMVRRAIGFAIDDGDKWTLVCPDILSDEDSIGEKPFPQRPADSLN